MFLGAALLIRVGSVYSVSSVFRPLQLLLYLATATAKAKAGTRMYGNGTDNAPISDQRWISMMTRCSSSFAYLCDP